MNIDKRHIIGITENGDPSFNLDVFDNLYRANIIITKRLTNNIIDKLIQYKDRCILHITCTGLGGSSIEKFVPNKEATFDKFKILIEKGFPVEQVVLRIDPIFPTDKGIEKAFGVIKLFGDSGIKRIRYSFFDAYEHVKDRFDEKGMKLPYDTFHADLKTRKMYAEQLNKAINDIGAEYEVCGEPGIESISCISQKDIDILGIDDISLIGSAGQRKSCGCPQNKKELIKDKPHQCNNECLYCFWK